MFSIVFTWIMISWLVCCQSLITLKNNYKIRTHQLDALSERAQQMFTSILEADSQVGGAGGSSTLEGLYNLDKVWSKLRTGGWKEPPPEIVFEHSSASTQPADFDIVVSGGTLGIFYAYALQKLGFTTCVIERGKIAGRPQEWNISRKELQVLKKLKMLTDDEIESIVGIEFNPVRVGFKTDTRTPDEGFELFVTDVLNLGIKPNILIDLVKAKYISEGGVVKELCKLSRIDVFDDLTELTTEENNAVGVVRSRLLIDAMGNGSPIVKQIRGPVEPDGVCIVVGTCGRGYCPSNNTYSDLIYTDTPLTKKSTSQLQYFWEAFPAGTSPSDRTTYLFTYMDAKPERPSICEIVEDYYELLPRYQGVAVEDLKFLRFLYGCFPTYRNSPLQSGFSRILQVGDASGIQSPLSFGGFGSLTRHIERITGAVKDALDDELLGKHTLALVNPYQPNLAACWMFQRSMSVPIGGDPRPDLVTGTLSNSFSSMQRLGPAVMLPFLQDVLQFTPLLRTLTLAAAQDPMTPFKIVPHVGLAAIGDFLFHFANMGIYTFLSHTVGPVVADIAPRCSPTLRFRLNRLREEWKFGSGLDYYDH